jgi:TRAP-type C4-dicarboxylate transport system substrate-binding protein
MDERDISRRKFLGSAGVVAAATAPISAGILTSACKKEEAASKKEVAAPLTLKLSSSLPNDPKFANGRVTYDALVKQIKAHGLADRIAVQFFPDNQLGQEIDVVNQVKLGAVDLMASGTSIWANLIPPVGVLDLLYLFQSYEHQTRALDAGAAALLEDWLLKGARTRVVGWEYNFGARSVLSRAPFVDPRGLAGKKIRTLPNPVLTEGVKLMGAAATPMAFGEIYTALQTGVLDGMEHDPPTIVASKFYENAKFYTLTEHLHGPLVLTLSDVTYQKMQPDIRDGFLAAAKAAALEARAHGLGIVKEAIGVLKERGVTVSDCDREAFRKRVQPLVQKFAQQHPEVQPVIAEIQAART